MIRVTRASLAIAAAALAAALLAGRAEAGGPTATYDIDNPLRVPYQETSTNCAVDFNACVFTYSVVPANKRLGITHVSCLFLVKNTDGISYAELGYEPTPTVPVFLPSVQQSNPAYVIVNADTSLFVPASKRPFVLIFPNTTGFVSAQCTILGYEISD